MKTFTIQGIRSWEPCYDPSVHLAEDWQGTVPDLLSLDRIPPVDRLWVVLREELIDPKTLRLFAVWCARQCDQTNSDCIAAIDTAERFANGLATPEELNAAWSAAESVAWSAAESVAWSAARSAQCDHLKKMISDDSTPFGVKT